MKKIVGILICGIMLLSTPAFAAPAHGGHGSGPAGGGHIAGHVSMSHGGGHGVPMHMHGGPVGSHRISHMPPPPMYGYHPTLYYDYYPTYSYYSYPIYTPYYYNAIPTVGVYPATEYALEPYAAINTTANVINTAANVANTIHYLAH